MINVNDTQNIPKKDVEKNSRGGGEGSEEGREAWETEQTET